MDEDIQIRLGISPITNKVYVSKMEEKDGVLIATGLKNDVTTDFRRTVVRFCSEVVEFEVDGMKFRATCERIE